MRYITRKQKIIYAAVAAVGIAALVGAGIYLNSVNERNADAAAEEEVRTATVDTEWYKALDPRGQEFVQTLMANKWATQNANSTLTFGEYGTYTIKTTMGVEEEVPYELSDVQSTGLYATQAIIKSGDEEGCVLITAPEDETVSSYVGFETDGSLSAACFSNGAKFYRMPAGKNLVITGTDDADFQRICKDVPAFNAQLMDWVDDNMPTVTEVAWAKTYTTDSANNTVTTEFITNTNNGATIAAAINQETGEVMFSDGHSFAAWPSSSSSSEAEEQSSTSSSTAEQQITSSSSTTAATTTPTVTRTTSTNATTQNTPTPTPTQSTTQQQQSSSSSSGYPVATATGELAE